ncbi:phospholipase A1 PLIP1, chloroplastic-like [Zingiber officinale]|uniref:phospholipase A1 PLIP1, chloroplastic-like n=1 Tax=Zingiber officinale TaxID=94328 RepID=UPI001C4B57BB|nr:phospholipase A1 PLIP1, chloroplastic-like [Zingiber officinale]XP_042473376.1 phospholipase A1 PLIP1, chloroplastic-like [Zingiber officinale]
MMTRAAVGIRVPCPEMAAEGMAGRMRRTQSSPQLRCSLAVVRSTASPTASLKSGMSVGALFPFGGIISNRIRSFMFEAEEEEESASAGELRLVEEIEADAGTEIRQRANWVSRILELRRRWRDRQRRQQQPSDAKGEDEVEREVAGEEDGYCGVSYDDMSPEEANGNQGEWDRESFARLLQPAAWSDTMLFSQLAFLCTKAYKIADIKVEELRAWYGLEFVTSSLETKSAAAIRAKLEVDSTRPPPSSPVASSLAYEVAASAASYVHSGAKVNVPLAGGSGVVGSCFPSESCSDAGTTNIRSYKNPEVAACVAASTMTAVVAAEAAVRQEAAKDLRSLHSSPCEWFVCDEARSRTRCFVIQGSDSLASWQANLFFEPTKFERMDVLVHRGIYEAAKGIYEQFLPEVAEHLRRYGDGARFRFTGHSLGGSLCILVAFMLLARGNVERRHLHPVVTFGTPSVFCGGERVLQALGLDDGFVLSVMMHLDIVPRAFSCDYPDQVAQLLKRLNGAFRSHPCLNNQKVLYSPLGRTYILQPDDQSSPYHPLLPQDSALYVFDGKHTGKEEGPSQAAAASASALRAFINSPHPLETLSDPRAYGSEGTILRDHDSSNYARAIAGLIRRHNKHLRRRSRKQRLEQWWPLLTSAAAGSCAGHQNPILQKPAQLVPNEVAITTTKGF